MNSQHDINGWTALHWAAKRNHLNIVNLLCNHGADKNIKTNKGELPASLTSEGVIKVLLSANLNASSNSNSNTPSPQPIKVGSDHITIDWELFLDHLERGEARHHSKLHP